MEEGEGVEERVPGRWSPAFRINTSTASLLGVRQVVSSPPFPRPLSLSCSCANLPRRLRTFVLSPPSLRPSFFLSLSRCHPHCRPSPGHSVCRSHSKPPSSSSSSSSCFAFLLPTFHLALHPEVSPLPLALSLRTLQIFPISFLRPLFRSIIPPSFLVRIANFSLSHSCHPPYFSSSKRKCRIYVTRYDTLCFNMWRCCAHGNDTRAPF